MSGTAVVNFALPNPAVYTDGTPMEIARVRIEARLDQAQSWGLVALIEPDPETGEIPTTREFHDTPGGRWHFRGIVVPTQGTPSNPLTGAPVDIPFGQASPLESFTVTLAPDE